MERLEVKNYVEKVITEETPDYELKQKLAFFNKMWASRTIDNERLLKGAINHYYDKRFKENKCNTKETVYDTAVYFAVSISTVKNTIYQYRNIVLKF